MATSIVEKYEQILAADPRSRIFVELAKALVDRGEHARAIEVCRRGLEFHPGSILGRIAWGRALLDSGDLKAAMDQFEIAIGLEPASPYAYNRVAEVLLAKELHREALPVLARAAELQPADGRLRSLLEEAKRRAKEAPAAAGPPAGRVEEETAPYGSPPAGPRLSIPPPVTRRSASGIPFPAATAPPPAPASTPAPPAGLDDTQPFPAPAPVSAAEASDEEEEVAEDEHAPLPHDVTQPIEVRGSAKAAASDKDETPSSSSTPTSTSTSTPTPTSTPTAAKNGTAPPPVPARRSVLHMIPDESAREVVPSLASRLNIPAVHATATLPARPADPTEAERAAAQYERELREKLMSAPEPPPSFVHRHRRLVAAGTVAIALAAAAFVYLFVSAQNAARAAAGAATKGRVGLARDTVASLREAQRLLLEARSRTSDPAVGALAAEVSALLATEHGDDAARATARALADAGAAGDGALAVAWLLAEGPEARAAAEPALLAARPSQGALLQELAGRILIARGELEGGRGRLELAARANPPLLRALAELGDLSLAAGDAEGALAIYGAALAAHPTHPRSAIGAAEARLALGRDLEVSRRELDAIDADPGSAPPRDARVRFEIARARVLAALGEPGAAASRLSRVAEKEESPRLGAALAEVLLQARSFPQAEAAAGRAVSHDPKDPELRVLLARARIGRGRFAEALQATDGVDGRAVRIQRAIARYRLGEWAEARAELERTGHDGKLPAEAAVWFGLVDVASGKADRALPLLERLVQATPPPPLASFALGRALEAVGRHADAEVAYRAAIAREPLAPEGPIALGRLLLATGRGRDAVAPLERAVKLDPSDLAARRALGEARLAAGQPSAARADLDFVLLGAPRDTAALRALSAAWLEEGQPREARLAADRALAVAPKDPAVLLAGARAAAAAGDAVAARKLAARALRAGLRGPDRDEAKRLTAGQLARKR